jgi:hypothetical protein
MLQALIGSRTNINSFRIIKNLDRCSNQTILNRKHGIIGVCAHTVSHYNELQFQFTIITNFVLKRSPRHHIVTIDAKRTFKIEKLF